MFETQSTDEWLPAWARRFKPFFVSFIITPFALLIGLPDFGPEGPQLWVGYAIFPFPGLAFLAVGFLELDIFFLPVLGLALCQFPAYGLVLSLATNRRTAWRAVFVIHFAALLLFFAGLAALMLVVSSV